MTDELSEVQERRLQSLKLLHGIASEHIAPTSDILATKLREANVAMSSTTLSNIYLRKTAIREPLARQIEKAMNVGEGWLGADHTSYLTASAEDIALFNRLMELPTQARQSLSSFLQTIGGDA